MTPATIENHGYSKAESWKIFDAISQRYDLLNSILSLGLHGSWRKRIRALTPQRPDLKILDLATGTADVLISISENNANITNAVGIDLSEKMLNIGRTKIIERGLNEQITLQKGDATQLTFLDNEFDMATMSFGIRNIENPILTLKEIFRVLRPEGRAVILEFSLPNNLFLRGLYLIYLKLIVPVIGGIVSGNFPAYFYLNRTIEKFPYGEMFARMMRQCGFKNVRITPLFFGVATIYCGDKAP